MARSRVDLPDPLLPISPTASPWYATKLTPLIAWTSRIVGDLVRDAIRLNADSGVLPGTGACTR
jgi:hypothetical protein